MKDNNIMLLLRTFVSINYFKIDDMKFQYANKGNNNKNTICYYLII